MKQQRSQLDSGLEARVVPESGGPPLTGRNVDRLLTDQGAEPRGEDLLEAAPMAGIWLGVVVGIALWAVMACVLLVARLD